MKRRPAPTIEEELEVLYDAYYNELENCAQQVEQVHLLLDLPGSIEVDKNGAVVSPVPANGLLSRTLTLLQ